MFTVRHAQPDDAEVITALVNSAYRGDSSRQGWTTEADLLEGIRITAGEVRDLITADDSVILLGVQGDEVIACVHLERTDDAAYLGLFVVRPTLQGGGLGKRFIEAAERTAQDLWGVGRMWMSVITVRRELIAFYERRGYRRTGRFSPFPELGDKGRVLVPGLQFEELEKSLTSAAAGSTSPADPPR